MRLNKPYSVPRKELTKCPRCKLYCTASKKECTHCGSLSDVELMDMKVSRERDAKHVRMIGNILLVIAIALFLILTSSSVNLFSNR